MGYRAYEYCILSGCDHVLIVVFSMEQTYRQRTAQDHKAELDQILSSYKVILF